VTFYIFTPNGDWIARYVSIDSAIETLQNIIDREPWLEDELAIIELAHGSGERIGFPMFLHARRPEWWEDRWKAYGWMPA